jgi:mandelate racemase
MALGGIDMAAWDARARAAGLPLATLLGSEPRPVPAYHSLGMGGAATAAAETEKAAAAGFTAVKLKIGYPEVAGDVEALRAARRAGGGRLAVMVDYNQSLTVPEAVARGRALAAEGPAWIEEPVTAEDLAGHARVARDLETPVQTGENWWAPRDLARAIEAQASDLAMLDIMKIGGVTGWLRAAALAEAHGLPVSSHLFPEISAQLLAVTPTAHWLEYQDWASPVLREPLRVERGTALPSDRPGTGVEWDEAAVRRYLVG